MSEFCIIYNLSNDPNCFIKYLNSSDAMMENVFVVLRDVIFMEHLIVGMVPMNEDVAVCNHR